MSRKDKRNMNPLRKHAAAVILIALAAVSIGMLTSKQGTTAQTGCSAKESVYQKISGLAKEIERDNDSYAQFTAGILHVVAGSYASCTNRELFEYVIPFAHAAMERNKQERAD